MAAEQTTVSVTILDKEYQVACPADEVDALRISARHLDLRMQEIRASGKVFGLDRIAVMAALNMANELIKSRGTGETLETEARERVETMRLRVENALQFGQQLDL